jgi:SAM-dependent methyltransferase
MVDGLDEGITADPQRLQTWPAFPPPGYLGQLRPEFQAQLATERESLKRDECFFYHSVDLPGGDTILGPWDLRGAEAAYLGGLSVKKKRVLELGPASGALTYYMERAGADVVAFDAGFDVSIDLHPHPGNEDMRKLQHDHARMIGDVQNSWWYLHREYRSRAACVYGNIYELPGDLGEFDVSVFGAILLHLRSPIAALEQAARRTRNTMVVTDTWDGGPMLLNDNIMRPFPYGDGGRWTVWWSISAGAVVRMLDTLGFRKVTVTTHTQKHQFGHDAEAVYGSMPMYTVVAHR